MCAGAVKETGISMGIKLTAFQYGKTEITQRMAFADGDNNINIPISLMFFLIEAGGRKIIVDPGCDTMPGFTLYDFSKPADVLTEYGVSPLDITDVLITHAHHDHIDCVRHYKNADVYIQEEAAKKGEKYLTESKVIHTYKSEISISKNIKMKCIGGHSIGSSIVLIELKDTTYVLCGDECYTKENLLFLKPTGCAFCGENSRFFVNEYSKNCYTPIVFHDGSLIGKKGAKVIVDTGK